MIEDDEMNENTKDLIYRLCGLAGFYYWETFCQSEGKGKKSKVFHGEKDDPEWCSDEWTMYEEDYNRIIEIKSILEKNEKKAKNASSEQLLKDIKWVSEKSGDDGVPKSISIYYDGDGGYVIYVIKAENEPGAIRRIRTCDTLKEATDYIRDHYDIKENP